MRRPRATRGRARRASRTLRQAQDEPYTGVIDAILEADGRFPRKQRHTAKRIFERLRDEYGFDGQHTIVKDYVREHRRRVREMFVPLSHAPGHAQCDFGEALAVIAGVERKVHYFVLDLPHSDGCFVKAYPGETTEAFLDGHVSAFAFLGGSTQSILYDNTKLAVAKILGHGRRKRTRAFTELQSHYLFEDRFGRSGKGNDKGNVEGMVDYARRNFLVPIPAVESFQALNAHLEGRCLSGWTPCCGDTPRPSASGWSGTWTRCCRCQPRPTTPATSRPASETPWTRELWIYDLRTNQHFTLKTNPLTRAHLNDFVSYYRAEDRTQREESERFRRFTYDELTQRDKANLDIFWLRDDSLEDSENLPPPERVRCGDHGGLARRPGTAGGDCWGLGVDDAATTIAD